MDRPLKILFAGEGGQGVQTIAKLMAKAAFSQGLKTIYIPNFGVEQRGGVSMAFVQIWDKQVDSPKFQYADVAMVLSDRAYVRMKRHLKKDTKVLYDPYTVVDAVGDLKGTVGEVYEIPATKTAKTQLTPRSANVLMMGSVSDITSTVDRGLLIQEMHKKFDKYYKNKPELRELNERAFKLGERFMPGGEE